MRVIDHAVLAMVCAMLLGFGEGLITVGRTPVALGAAGAGAALLAITAVPFGLLQGVVAKLASDVARRLGFSGRWARALDADAAAPREPVVRFHAGAVALLVAGAGALAASWPLLAQLDSVADDALRRWLTIGIFAALAAAALFGWAVGARLLEPVMAALDARLGLPWPRRAVFRVVLYGVLPSAAVLVPMWMRYRQALGRLSLVLILALFVVGELFALHVWRWQRPPWAKRPVKAATVAAVWCITAVLAVAAMRVAEIHTAVTTRTSFISAALELWIGITDFDRDGFSGVLTGADCKPFNRNIHPSAWDVPENGIDENCDGQDARSASDGEHSLDLPWSSEVALRRSQLTPRRYNVVWVVVDAVRADRVSFLDHQRPTTPYLASLAKQALVFSAAYSQSSATMLSVPSMFTGLDPASMMWLEERRLQADPQHETLAERLKKEGYRSAIVVDGYITKALPALAEGFGDVLSVWLDGKRRPWHEKSGTIATNLAIQWLERDVTLGTPNAQPFFLLVYSSSPHDPYTKHRELGIDFGDAELDRYDAEIAFTDRGVGFLVDYLKYRLPLWDNTVFVFTADHGEEFGEHGGRIHAYTCYVESVHVPLLVRVPGVRGARVDTPVALIDIVPTILQALGLEPRDMRLDGQSLLVPAFAPEERPSGRSLFCAVLSQKEKQGNFFRRSVRRGTRALMHDDVTGTYELYDTKADPGEHANLIDAPAESPTVEQLKRVLQQSMKGNLQQSRLTD